jgi:hypothetical protein
MGGIAMLQYEYALGVRAVGATRRSELYRDRDGRGKRVRARTTWEESWKVRQQRER